MSAGKIARSHFAAAIAQAKAEGQDLDAVARTLLAEAVKSMLERRSVKDVQAEILAAGTSQPVNLTLVEQGLALWDHRPGSLCDRQRYSQAERAARRRRLGQWGPAPAAPGMRP